MIVPEVEVIHDSPFPPEIPVIRPGSSAFIGLAKSINKIA